MLIVHASGVREVTERDLSILMGHELHAHAGGDRMIRAKSQAEGTRRACDCSAMSPSCPPPSDMAFALSHEPTRLFSRPAIHPAPEVSN